MQLAIHWQRAWRTHPPKMPAVFGILLLAACGSEKENNAASGGSASGGFSNSTGGAALGGKATGDGGRSSLGGAAPQGGTSTSAGGGASGGGVPSGGSGPLGGTTGSAGTTSGGKAAGGSSAGGRSASGNGGAASGGTLSAGTGGALGSGGLSSAGGPSGGTGGAGEPATVGWVLSYFGPEQSVAADSLHLAYSTDALHWTRLGSGSPAYQLTGLGTNHIRDPFILRKADGTFAYIATDWTLSNNDSNYWNNPSSKIFVADSKDLITFSNPRLLTLTSQKGPNQKSMHAWAPEAYYDAAADQYAIIWSGNDTTDTNRIYVSYTKDFKTLTSAEPKVLFDPGYSVIDGTFTTWDGSGYLFFKDETDNSGSSLTGSGKDIQVARAASASLTPGSFTRWDPAYIPRGSNQATRQATEGPFVIKVPDQKLWYLYADFYTQGGIFGCWSTTDLGAKPSSWTKLAQGAYSLPTGVRHANTVRVTQAELDALKAHYK